MKHFLECLDHELLQALPFRLDHLLVSASFEERAHTVWAQLNPLVLGKWVCYNKNHESYLASSLDKFVRAASGCKVVPLDSDNPGFTFRALLSIFEELGKEVLKIGIDVTGFTKETVAMLVFLAKNCLNPASELIVFYHRAERYGKTPSKGWLSQGVREIRTILGYSGKLRLSSSTELLLIPGFEVERAQEIVDSIEPAQFTLGVLRPEEVSSGKNPHDSPLDEFTCRVRSLYALSRIGELHFSASDPFFTRDSIVEMAKKSPCNVVVSCLNSKPAMVGVCLAALEFPALQLIYAQPLFYNVENYSEPSGRLILFSLFGENPER